MSSSVILIIFFAILSNLLNEFFKFVKSAFQFKRKNLRNNLKNYDLEKMNKGLVKYNQNLQNRAEEISLNEFIDIYRYLYEN